MDQQANAGDEVPLGLESAWPGSDQLAIIFGGPTAVQGLDSSSSSYPQRDAEVGAAFPLRAAGFALAALLLVATPPAGAAPYAPQEYDFSEAQAIGPAVHGVVESVRAVPLPADRSGLANVFEHALNAETGEELVLRLDDGRLATVLLEGAGRFHPGDRVRLLGGRLLRT